MLKLANPHPRDERIRFVDETHTYYIDGSSDGYISSTTLVHELFEKFDADKVIRKMMSSKRWPQSPYFGKTSEQIKRSWDTSRDSAAKAGTAMHMNIENFYNDAKYTKNVEFELFENFKKDYNFEPFRTEWEIFDESSKVAGSIDMLYKDPDDEDSLIIADWKRCKKIETSNRWQMGSDKLTRHLYDCNFVHYSIQLGIYKYILQKKYGKKISKTFIVVLHPSQKNYIRIDTMDVDDIVCALMNRRQGKEIPEKVGVKRKSGGGGFDFDVTGLKF